MNAVVIYSYRYDRSADTAAAASMTVGELIDYLGEFNPEAKIIIEGYDGNLFNPITYDGTIEDRTEGAGEDEEVVE